jgi:hypothetical protein
MGKEDTKMSYRKFLNVLLLVVFLGFMSATGVLAQPLPGGTLNPTTIPKYVDPLIIPPPMPKVSSDSVDYYEITVRQFKQQILPSTGFINKKAFPKTTVWSYVKDDDPATFNYPAFTIEATVGTPTRVKWINGLVDKNGNYLKHLLPVDQTLHWANPPAGPTCFAPTFVSTAQRPIVTHLEIPHGN